MTEISNNSGESVETKKLRELCNLVLRRADAEHDDIIDDVRNEINQWTNEQEVMLDAECDSILKDANKRAEEIVIRQINNAKIESSRERIRLQNKYVNEARAIFQSKLEALRKRGDYKEILMGLAIEAIGEVPRGHDLLFRLSGADAGLGDEIAEIIREVMQVNITFSHLPGEFNGGVMISSADGRWNVISDWRAKTEELADVIATRVLAAL